MSYCAHCGTEVQDAGRTCPACGKHPSGGVYVSGWPRANAAVVVAVIVVTLLGVVFVAGIVAAIAIPNFLQAVDRGKQKRTLAEIRSIAAAVEAYATDHGLYPTAPDLAALERLLEPRYTRNVAKVDGWNHPIEYLPGPGVGYTLRSPGKDGVVETTPVGGPTLDFDCDIVLVNGEFTQWPDGMRR